MAFLSKLLRPQTAGACKTRADNPSHGALSRPSLGEILEGLTEDRINEMLPFSRALSYRTNDKVVVEGAESRCLYYVEKGSVEVSYRVGETPIIVALIGPSSSIR